MATDKRTIIDESQDDGLNHKIHHAAQSKLDIKPPRLQWLRDKPDTRDYKYAISKAVPLPVKDLRVYCSSIENQGNLGSCTGNAIAGAIELLNKRNKKPTDVSRLFIYYYERLIEGTLNYDSGAYIRDGIKVVNKYGAPLESLWPYQINKFKLTPSAPAIIDGAKRKVTLYERAKNFTECKDAINNGYPVIIGFDVYSSFYSIDNTGLMPYPKPNESLLGGHAVLLVGYNDTTQTFIVRNSWGTSWGDKGYFYMPYKVIQNSSMSSDFWVIKSVNNP